MADSSTGTDARLPTPPLDTDESLGQSSSANARSSVHQDHIAEASDDEAETSQSPTRDVPAHSRRSSRSRLASPVDHRSQDDRVSDSGSSTGSSDEEKFHRRSLKKRAKHLKQALRWQQGIDRRLRYLEKGIEKHQGRPERKTKSTSPLVDGPPPQVEDIKVMKWEEFQPSEAPKRLDDQHGKFHNFRYDTTVGHVIEVLLEEPSISTQGSISIARDAQSKSCVDNTSSTADELPTRLETDMYQRPATKAPARVRIRSREVMESIGDAANIYFGDKPYKVTYRRPFKFFFRYESEIRAKLLELEGMVQKERENHSIVSVVPDAPTEQPVQYGTNGIGGHPGNPGDQDTASNESSQPESAGAPIEPGISDGLPIPATNASAEASTQRSKAEIALCHLRLLVRFMDEYLQPISDLRRDLREYKDLKIAFDDLWHLFQFNEEVLIRDKKEEEAGIYRVLYFTGGRRILDPKFPKPSKPFWDSLEGGGWQGSFGVQCWRLEFDGHAFIPVVRTFGIRRYEGLKDITSLPVFPLKFERKWQDIRASLLQRGERYITHSKRGNNSHLRYLGPDCDDDSRRQQIDSEVVIDFTEAFAEGFDAPKPFDEGKDRITPDFRETQETIVRNVFCKDAGCCTSDVFHSDDYTDEDNYHSVFRTRESGLLDTRNEITSDDDRVLLPGYVYGYVLRHRTWARMSIDPKLLRNVDVRNRWEDLVIPEENKDTILALVQRHIGHANDQQSKSGNKQMESFISGKGRGLVFLLHGPPGVGKTSTAECISTQTKLPLYQLTSGNLGVDPDDIERELERHFALAAKWKCILLLDEADVFLQRRYPSQLQINAIVSVFLRQLEYYPGILFLTTNRVGDIDRAFMSRIHMAIRYDPFDETTTVRVFELNLKLVEAALADKGVALKVKHREIMDFARRHYEKRSKNRTQWNGRQIYNACQTAIALAEWDVYNKDKDSDDEDDGANTAEPAKPVKVILRRDHFKRVARASEDFEEYMTELAGEEYKEAHRAGFRQDYPSPRAVRNEPYQGWTQGGLGVQQRPGAQWSDDEAPPARSAKKSAGKKASKMESEEEVSSDEERRKRKKATKKKKQQQDDGSDDSP
ncbi:hypothetical protein CAC42_2026 [Sphaceloma murrayae]|uniref:AAA+ ATPase domain-containing protein n=1 Tax=Sphaceloma murrayae TaxID=2082308 RepID=A0A2K1QI26_9PEZI|nr:hypothetical protein CAC42_2026 [Sphaceloma murrayae]